MPRNRQRTTTKAAWTEENLQSAKIAIERGSSIRKAAKQYNIPFSTLKDRLKNEDMSSPRLGRKPVFTQQQETEIAEQVTGFAVLWTQYRRFAKTGL
uniref:SFRICE_026979 n=1 Tax=Spodoptera frugiperda TaxID=7108 RepID=A0A2H1VZL2_SPOFR